MAEVIITRMSTGKDEHREFITITMTTRQRPEALDTITE